MIKVKGAMHITRFEPVFTSRLPETLDILMDSNLVVHPLVDQITLHGSRGLAGGNRLDSDIDLSLVVHTLKPPAISKKLSEQLQEVLNLTLTNWHSPVQADLAAIFPLTTCHLLCFQKTDFEAALCPESGVDCFGIYKQQKGFEGFVLNEGITVERMYPCITIWKKDK